MFNVRKEGIMARILENGKGKRTVLLTADDIISVVREYQRAAFNSFSYEQIRKKLSEKHIYLPEECV